MGGGGGGGGGRLVVVVVLLLGGGAGVALLGGRMGHGGESAAGPTGPAGRGRFPLVVVPLVVRLLTLTTPPAGAPAVVLTAGGLGLGTGGVPVLLVTLPTLGAGVLLWLLGGVEPVVGAGGGGAAVTAAAGGGRCAAGPAATGGAGGCGGFAAVGGGPAAAGPIGWVLVSGQHLGSLASAAQFSCAKVEGGVGVCMHRR